MMLDLSEISNLPAKMAFWAWHDSCQAFAWAEAQLSSLERTGGGVGRAAPEGIVSGILIQLSKSSAGWRVRRGERSRLSLDLKASQSEGRSLADVEDLGGAEEPGEGGKVSFEGQSSGEAAERGFSLLAVAVAGEVAPGEAGGGDLEGVGRIEKGAEIPVEGRSGVMEMQELKGSAEHGEGQGAEAEGLGELAADLQARGGEEAQDGAVAFEAGGRRARRQGRADGGAAVYIDRLPGAGGAEGPGFGEREGEAAVAQAGGGHALDGEQDVGLEVHGLSEKEQVECEGIARREVPGAGEGFEDVGARGGLQAVEEGRRRVLDEGFEEPGVDAHAA
jgi:hypothetical protein